MKPIYKIGQEVYTMNFNDSEPKYYTKKHIIKGFSVNKWTPGVEYIFDDKFDSHCHENCIYATEKELSESISPDVYLSEKNCYKSELKYIEREKKLKRILNI